MEGVDLLHRELLKQQLKGNFFEFVKYFWDVIINETPVYNWHIEYLCNELEKVNKRVVKRLPKEYDLIINVPPGSSKSTICTIMYPSWVWVNDPTQRFITGSYSLSLSREHATKTRDILRHEKFSDLFQECQLRNDKDTKTNYENVSGGQRFSTSIGAAATGMHGHQIIIDDPLNPNGAISDVERENANDWLEKTLSTRKVDKEVTPTILIMQRLHELDPTGYNLSKDKKIRHICLPGELNENVKPEECKQFYKEGLLDPVRLSRTVLNELSVDLGSYGYSGQILQNPVPFEGGILKKDWFEVITEEQLYEKVPKSLLTWDFKLDTAYTADTKNDPSALYCSAFHDNVIYIREVKEVYMEQPDLIKEIIAFTEKNDYSNRSKIKIEPKANGLSTIQIIKKETNMNVIPYKFAKDKGISYNDSKETRVHAISPIVETGRVVLIKGAWNNSFIEQCCNFPRAAHDDMVDCLVMDVAENLLFKRESKRYIKVRN